MTQAKLNVFRKALENKQSELGSGNRNREAFAIETSADPFDCIQHASERDFAMGIMERSSSLLRDVRSALVQMDRGAYGICARCEEEINPKRLTAIPWASLCVVCQDGMDREMTSVPGVSPHTEFEMAA